LEFLANNRVHSSFGQQKIEPINEENTVLKNEIERTTADDVIQISKSQVKLNEEFNRLRRREGQQGCRFHVVAAKMVSSRSYSHPKVEASMTIVCGDAIKGAREAAGQID
jgi:hypothetical protein